MSIKTPQRVAAMAMVMGLCLLVYRLGQRSLRQALDNAQQTVEHQVGKSTAKPTLRWMFQCFMSIHLLTFEGAKHVTNLTTERLLGGWSGYRSQTPPGMPTLVKGLRRFESIFEGWQLSQIRLVYTR